MRGEERRDLEKRGLQIEVAEEIWRAYHEVGGGEGRDGDGEEGGDGPGGDERHAQALEGGRHGLGGLHVEHRARAGARAGSGDGLEGHAQPRGAGGGRERGGAGAGCVTKERALHQHISSTQESPPPPGGGGGEPQRYYDRLPR